MWMGGICWVPAPSVAPQNDRHLGTDVGRRYSAKDLFAPRGNEPLAQSTLLGPDGGGIEKEEHPIDKSRGFPATSCIFRLQFSGLAVAVFFGVDNLGWAHWV